ncbi:peptidase inhibitor family I36 protein [Streptomyces sp. NPDC059153]|uniref:peptidase inhibitor family I36 protein n=1 Tax=Streptomyces sp. NPDC059153 TaxID=3346743 RepID=UPI0036805500
MLHPHGDSVLLDHQDPSLSGVQTPGSGPVCIYPEIYFGGQPWVRRAVDGGVKDLPSEIRDRGSSVRNNSDRTARVYEKRNYSGRWVCVTRSGGSIHDLRGYNLNDQTRSLKISRNDCG